MLLSFLMPFDFCSLDWAQGQNIDLEPNEQLNLLVFFYYSTCINRINEEIYLILFSIWPSF